jgi:ABC-type transport system involved in multi-copper enzyme maturation permease subunit
MMKSLFRELLIENPMTLENRRQLRRFLGTGKSGVSSAAATVLAGIAYVILLSVTIRYRQYIDPIWIIYLQTFLFCFIVPSVLHGAIAAERENRTWDFLAVAPVSKGQIVIGKLLTGLVVITAITLFLMVPGLVSIIGKSAPGKELATFMKGEMISVGFAFALAALTMWVSALSHRVFTAQGAVYGILLGLLLVWPVVAGVLTTGFAATDEKMFEYLVYFHPFTAITMAAYPREFHTVQPLPGYGYVHLGFFLLMAAAFTYLAILALRNVKGDAQLYSEKKQRA